MLRYQFWGFGLFVFALYAKNLVQGNKADTSSLALSAMGGLVGGGLGMVLAQRWKDRVPPIRLLLASMILLGAGTLVFGLSVSVAGFAGMLFVGFFSFFLGKISADTITQQAMPDDFRGRAFALFDIAYNLGFIIPAFILSIIWIEGDPTRTRAILVGSGDRVPRAHRAHRDVGEAHPRPVHAPGRPAARRRGLGGTRLDRQLTGIRRPLSAAR